MVDSSLRVCTRREMQLLCYRHAQVKDPKTRTLIWQNIMETHCYKLVG